MKTCKNARVQHAQYTKAAAEPEKPLFTVSIEEAHKAGKF